MTTPSSAAGRRLPEFSAQVFLLCLGTLLLEVSYTRVFSFKLFYYFAFMVIGFALLGLGSGGVLLALSRRVRDTPRELVVAAGSLAASVLVVAGYAVVASVPTATLAMAQDAAELARMGILCATLFSVFLAVGVVLASLFSHESRDLGRLYAVDLVGAAAGCALAIPAMKALTPPGAIMAAAAAFAAAGAITRGSAGPGTESGAGLRAGDRLRVASCAAAAVALVLAVMPSWMPSLRPDAIKFLRGGGSEALWTRWSPIFRVDVVEPPAGAAPDPMVGERLIIAHDGLLGSTLQKFDGNLASLGRFDRDPRRLPFTVVPQGPEVLVIGAAGGHEILASLYYGARRVTGVELNPATIELLTGPFADYTGRIAFDPRVRLLNGEGRSWLARRDGNFDVVFFVAPDSYAAMNAAASGAFVLSESYLYTVEAIGEALAATTDGGVVCMQFGEYYFDAKPNRTLRYLASAREALGRLGADDPAAHVLVAITRGSDTQVSTILVSRRPFTAEAVDAFRTRADATVETTVQYAGRGRGGDARLATVLEADADGLARFLGDYPYAVDAVHDDAPFFWHFARFGDLVAGRDAALRRLPDIEDSVGERVLMRMLAVSAAFAFAFLLLPFAALRGTWSRLPRKGAALAFFAAIGVGFLLLETSLIQRLVLLLGYPTHSLAVTLMTLLLSSGIGSAAVAGRRTPAVPLLLGIAACVVFYAWGLPPLVHAMARSSDIAKVAAAMAVIFPLGLCLGAFLPLGVAELARLAPGDARAYSAWGWAVNGFFSVLSSVLGTMLSMSFGFAAVAWMALGCYGVAALALARLRSGAAAG